MPYIPEALSISSTAQYNTVKQNKTNTENDYSRPWVHSKGFGDGELTLFCVYD